MRGARHRTADRGWVLRHRISGAIGTQIRPWSAPSRDGNSGQPVSEQGAGELSLPSKIREGKRSLVRFGAKQLVYSLQPSHLPGY